MRILAALILVLAASAVAAKEPSVGEEGTKRICRAAAATTGSHMHQPPVCRTATEWQAIEEAQRRALPLRTKAPQPESWERSRPQ
jgi:hypothetical protein